MHDFELKTLFIVHLKFNFHLTFVFLFTKSVNLNV
jgi:hypothetical protein